MPLSIEESIKKLKAEIIAQDWRLSPKRAAGLEEAFQCLRQRFKNRKATHAMLVMAGSVLDYIKKRGGKPPETIDFLKESMAHVVNLYEDLTFDPEREELVFAGLFKRFQRLKNKIKVESGGPFRPDELQADYSQQIAAFEPVSSPTTESGKLENSDKVETLIDDLKNSLERAGEAGTAISRLLAEALKSQGVPPEPKEEAGQQIIPEVPQPAKDTVAEPSRQAVARIQACPPTEMRELVINGIKLAIPVEIIAMVRQLKPARLKSCLHSSHVPLKYFAGFMQRLSRRLTGSLAGIKDSKLKKMILPIITPRGFEFPEVPDQQASTLVIISNGNWHGVLACSEVQDEIPLMVEFEKQKNGDIAGFGYLEDGRQVMLLDSQAILRREGFLLMT